MRISNLIQIWRKAVSIVWKVRRIIRPTLGRTLRRVSNVLTGGYLHSLQKTMNEQAAEIKSLKAMIGQEHDNRQTQIVADFERKIRANYARDTN